MADHVLAITSSGDVTADYLCRRMAEAGTPCLRFDSDCGLTGVNAEYANGIPCLTLGKTSITPDVIRHVWYRRPEELRVDSNLCDCEQKHIVAEWTAAIEGFLGHIPIRAWVNHPSRNAGASHKIEQLTHASRVGLNVPETLLTQSPKSLREFWEKCGGEVVVKPLVAGYLEKPDPADDTQIYTNQVRAEHLDRVESTLPVCPTLFQQLIKKALDVRITVIDGQYFPVGIEARESGGTQRLDIRRNNMEDVSYVDVKLPRGVEGALCRILKSYGLRFAAIDMALDLDRNWIFFEINPNGQWAWMDLAGITNIAGAFIEAFGS